MRRSRTILLVTGVFFGSVSLAPAAGALQTGVYVAPGSPAGKQYAFPLGVLRGAAAGQSASQPVISPPLFGVGIVPPGQVGVGTPGSPPANPARLGGAKARLAGASGSRPGARTGGTFDSTSSQPRRPALASLVHQSSVAPDVAPIIGGVLLGGLALGAALLVAGRRRRE